MQGDVGAIFACVAAGQAICGFATPFYNKIYQAVITMMMMMMFMMLMMMIMINIDAYAYDNKLSVDLRLLSITRYIKR